MKQTRKTIIIIASAASAILVALAVLFALTVVVKADYTERINKGNQYLESGNFDKAVVEFKAALEMDEEKDDAYEGLCLAYEGLGYTMLSQQILEQGLSATGSEKLRLMLAKKFPDSSYLLDGAVAGADDAEPALNTSLLAMIAGATYGDYEHKYDVTFAGEEGTLYRYNIEDLGLELEYNNSGSQNKINQGNNTPYREMMPDSVSVDNLSLLFGTTAPISIETIKSLDGVRDLTVLDNGITFKASGCRVTIYGDGKEISSDAENTIVSLKELGEDDDDNKEKNSRVLRGSITDATSGEPVSGAKIKIYAGTSASGKPVETKSDSSGFYTAEVESGDYFVVVEKDGYITGEFSVYVMTKADSTYQDCAISPVLREGEIRIVLTWDASPKDLDSYLEGTTRTGNHVMTKYSDKRKYDGKGNLVAELDLDDTDGYGPETTTLYDMEGTYEFSVVDYNWTGTMARSNAQVKVYQGNALVETIHIHSGVENMWMVLKIDKGKITVINEPFSASTSAGNK